MSQFEIGRHLRRPSTQVNQMPGAARGKISPAGILGLTAPLKKFGIWSCSSINFRSIYTCLPLLTIIGKQGVGPDVD